MNQTLFEVLDALRQEEQVGIHYIQPDGSTIFQSYHQLYEEATRLLSGLRHLEVMPGDCFIIASADNADVIPLFWACVLGGVTPTILPPPSSLYHRSAALEKLENVWNVLEQPEVVVPARLLEHQMDMVPVIDIQQSQLHTCFSIKQYQETAEVIKPKPSDTGFIQFSSGTTGDPKGVVLSHENIVTNLDAIAEPLYTFEKDHQEGTSLNWLPLYHDMGLVGFHLTPMYMKHSQYQMNPLEFIKNPVLWLNSVQQYRPAISAAPNFSQQILQGYSKRHPDKEWDLSSLLFLYNGAEPISVELMQRFTQEMMRHQLSPSAMLPVYGLAEATLAVSFSPAGELPVVECLDREALQEKRQAVTVDKGQADAIRFVNVGHAVKGCEVRIVDEQDQEVADATVGHIQVRGKHVTQGYYQGTHDNLFCDDWLRTGDMGFLRGGRLCVTGRMKDIIFINGKNYYANDIESVAMQVIHENFSKLIICGAFDEKEQRDLILAFIVGENPIQVARQFIDTRLHLRHQIGVNLDVLIPLSRRELPRTTSGKVQRFKLREQYEQGIFDSAIEKISELVRKEEQGEGQGSKIAPQSFTEKILHEICCEELGLPPDELGIHDSFLDLGISSVIALRILKRLEMRYHITLDTSLFAKCFNINELAEYIDKHPTAVHNPQGVFSG